MDIENTSTVEQSADQANAFLEGWGDETPATEQTADQQEAMDEGAQEGSVTDTEGASADGEATEQTQTETTAEVTDESTAGDEQKPAPASWTIKHMGAEKTLGVADISPELLQKGMDYDRVRGKYDEAKPVMELFTQFAKQANMTLGDYVKHIREEAKKAAGMSAEEAKRAVDLEDREAAVSAKEAQQQEGERSQAEQRAKVDADLAEFQRAFPDVFAKAKSGDPDAIPDCVWAEVNKGDFTLTAAYSRYIVARAKEQETAARQAQQTAEQNQRNAQRSTGSQKSAGSDVKPGNAFLEGFDG